MSNTPHLLRALRKGRGLTMRQLANLAGVSASTISRIESRDQRRVNIETAVRLARVFNTEPLKIFREEEISLTGKGPGAAGHRRQGLGIGTRMLSCSNCHLLTPTGREHCINCDCILPQATA